MTERVFDASLYRYDRVEPSYWEATAERPTVPSLVQDEAADVAVIGGGYTGLSTALHLARDHGIEAVVLDAGVPAWGASGRNGGLVCIPPAKASIPEMVRRWGRDETAAFYRWAIAGCDLARTLPADEGFDVCAQGDGNLEVADHPSRLAGLVEEAGHLTALTGVPTRILDRAAFAEVGHGGTEQFGGVHVGVGFALHPMAYALGLLGAARRRGVRVYAHSPVVRWDRDGSDHRLVAANGASVRARRVVVAANGWTPDGLHRGLDARVLPAISNILVTRPLGDAELAAESWNTETAIVNARTLLFYYRLLPDRRLLFGARGDTAGTTAAADRMQAWMHRRLGELFPSWAGIEVDYRWRGLVAMTRKRAPSIGAVNDDPSVHYAFGYHAAGVAAAPMAGKTVADAIALGSAAAPVPAVLRGLPARFPMAAMRRLALAGAYLWYGTRDRLQELRHTGAD
ncbi:FAD-dependent oxidoreductase [Thalassobaculum sp.]|uniref:NAD(P)/FAD-dependent oxidoreductase n=1 Tax=Thalassobaculum sp. TaxID=2022740 RepID=UPI0032EB6491